VEQIKVITKNIEGARNGLTDEINNKLLLGTDIDEKTA